MTRSGRVRNVPKLMAGNVERSRKRAATRLNGSRRRAKDGPRHFRLRKHTSNTRKARTSARIFQISQSVASARSCRFVATGPRRVVVYEKQHREERWDG